MKKLSDKPVKSFSSRIKRTIRLIRYLRGLHLYMVFNCLVGLVFNAIPIVIAFVTSRMVGSLLSKSNQSTHSILVIVFSLVIAHAVFCYGDLWFSHDIAYKILIKIRQHIYEHLEKCIPSFRKQMSSAEMASIATQDVEYLEWFYAHTINSAIISFIIAVSIIGILFYIHPLFGMILISAVLMIYLIPVLYRKKSSLDGTTMRSANGALEDAMAEGIQGMREIIGFSWNESFIQYYQEKESKFQHAMICDAKRRGRETFFSDLIKGLVGIVLLVVSAYLSQSGQIATSWIPSIMTLSMLLFVPLNVFIGMTQQFSTIFASAERVLDLLEFPQMEITDGTRPLPDTLEKIEFEHVSFHYPDSDNPVLDDVNFTLKHGEFVSLAGVSGSGKTTIVNLLQRYIEPTSGIIKLNGIDIREYSLQAWKNLYSIVQQNAYLFNLDISENILMNKLDGSKEEVVTVAKKAQAHSFIRKMKQGYQTPVGEKGSRLSGGEKQRISISRALIKNAPILIMDEATANLDNKTERLFWQTLREPGEKRLIVNVAHRITSIEHADRIIFLSEGKIHDMGDYRELCDKNGLFRKQILGIDG